MAKRLPIIAFSVLFVINFSADIFAAAGGAGGRHRDEAGVLDRSVRARGEAGAAGGVPADTADEETEAKLAAEFGYTTVDEYLDACSQYVKAAQAAIARYQEAVAASSAAASPEALSPAAAGPGALSAARAAAAAAGALVEDKESREVSNPSEKDDDQDNPDLDRPAGIPAKAAASAGAGGARGTGAAAPVAAASSPANPMTLRFPELSTDEANRRYEASMAARAAERAAKAATLERERDLERVCRDNARRRDVEIEVVWAERLCSVIPKIAEAKSPEELKEAELDYEIIERQLQEIEKRQALRNPETAPAIAATQAARKKTFEEAQSQSCARFRFPTAPKQEVGGLSYLLEFFKGRIKGRKKS